MGSSFWTLRNLGFFGGVNNSFTVGGGHLGFFSTADGSNFFSGRHETLFGAPKDFFLVVDVGIDDLEALDAILGGVETFKILLRTGVLLRTFCCATLLQLLAP